MTDEIETLRSARELELQAKAYRTLVERCQELRGELRRGESAVVSLRQQLSANEEMLAACARTVQQIVLSTLAEIELLRWESE